MTWLAGLLGVDPELIRVLSALCSLIAALFSAAGAVVLFLHRAAGKRAEDSAAAAAKSGAETLVAVEALVAVVKTQKSSHDALWAAYIAKDTVATPDGVRRIATETAQELTERELRPLRTFSAAIELVESRRDHRPETDLIRILEGAS